MKDSVINKRQYSLIAIPAAYLICAVSMFLPLLKLGNFSISMIDLRTGLNSAPNAAETKEKEDASIET